MSLYTIKNLLSKFSTKEVNILYFPSMSVLDIAILDIPVNYFGNTNIKHKNLTNISELTWLSYDFIFTHFIDDNIVNISNAFHIPILYYINNQNKTKTPVPKNTIFLYDTLNPIAIENGICINLINNNTNITETSKTKDCLVINYHVSKLNENIKKSLIDNIPEVTIMDSLPNSTNDLAAAFATHKVCIDFTPSNVHDSILALKNKCVCVNFYDEKNVCENKYDNLYYVDNLNYDAYQNLIQFYNSNQFNNDLQKINSQNNTNSWSDLASVYGLLKYRRYVI